MVKSIALLALIALGFGLTLGNYWFTFGLWPRSWWSFVLFAAANLTVSFLIQTVTKAEE